MAQDFRVFKKKTKQYDLYKQCHTNQTVNFVNQKIQQYSNLNNSTMTMNKTLELINDFIDPSDPDLDLPNSIHAYQTAERIRKDYPDNKEFFWFDFFSLELFVFFFLFLLLSLLLLLGLSVNTAFFVAF